ncbi:hypothetical protein TNCV_4353321 [Trichonephila clavipes]|nr:hypothetical protein TNCV_4353321 [Trichonephila clavipes]
MCHSPVCRLCTSVESFKGVLGTFRSKRNASTLPITPRRPSSRDVGTSSYKYHSPHNPVAAVAEWYRYRIVAGMS